MLIEVIPYQTAWADQFRQTAHALRAAFGDVALRIDHIGSTAVPGLAAKPVIDVQVTVASLTDVVTMIGPLNAIGLEHRQHITEDRAPQWEESTPEEWTKQYFRTATSQLPRLHVHIREHGRRTQRYPLLMRDFLRADGRAREAYALYKLRLSDTLARYSEPGGTGPYLDLKDPFFDLLAAHAEDWANLCDWSPGPADA